MTHNVLKKMKVKKKQLKKQENSFMKGASLIELMLAVAIFTISIIGVAHLFIGSQNSMNYSLEKLQAAFLAKGGIEEKRAITNTDFDLLSAGSSSEIITLNEKEYERTINISFLGEGEAEITSTVEWQGMGREEMVYYKEILTDWSSGEPEEEGGEMCGEIGDHCEANEDCCNESCQISCSVYSNYLTCCKPSGEPCSSNEECCSNFCSEGLCEPGGICPI